MEFVGVEASYTTVELVDDAVIIIRASDLVGGAGPNSFYFRVTGFSHESSGLAISRASW